MSIKANAIICTSAMTVTQLNHNLAVALPGKDITDNPCRGRGRRPLMMIATCVKPAAKDELRIGQGLARTLIA